MAHIQVSIQATEETQELLIAQLNVLQSTGFEQSSTHLLAYFSEDAFLSYDVTQVLNGFHFQTEIIADQNWNELWESNFEPVVINDFCAIRAHFHQPIKNVNHDIVITPKMSFGTGHHATTYMMIEQMQELSFTGKTVFDFGTGTGVLAILAEKMSAANIVAIDVDTWSIENAKENVERNKCTKISLSLSTALPLAKFDVVLANINKNVILEYLSQLKKTVDEHGFLLLSGLLQADEEDIVAACSLQRLILKKKTVRAGWISLLFCHDA